MAKQKNNDGEAPVSPDVNPPAATPDPDIAEPSKEAPAADGDLVGKALSDADRSRIRDLKSKARALTEAMKGFAFLTGETLPNEALTGVEIAVVRAITVIETEAVKRFLERTQGQTAAA